MTRITAPIRYAGSKLRLMSRLIPMIPKHQRYVSVFGGSAADLMVKPRSQAETWNDLDDRLHNLFSVLKHPRRFQELGRLVRLTLYSRSEFEAAVQILRDNRAGPVRRAWATLVVANQCIAGVPLSLARPSSWGALKVPRPPARWPTLPHTLAATKARFRRVVVEHLPWEKLVDKYDGPNVFFYMDPPYVLGTRVSKRLYQHEMSDEDHRKLLEKIQRLEGKVMLSGYDCELYNSELQHWKRYEFSTRAHISAAKTKPPRTEVVWCNYVLKGGKS